MIARPPDTGRQYREPSSALGSESTAAIEADLENNLTTEMAAGHKKSPGESRGNLKQKEMRLDNLLYCLRKVSHTGHGLPMKAKKGYKEMKTRTSTGKWLKKYFATRTSRRYKFKGL
jgi:hypothetical protein